MTQLSRGTVNDASASTQKGTGDILTSSATCEPTTDPTQRSFCDEVGPKLKPTTGKERPANVKPTRVEEIVLHGTARSASADARRVRREKARTGVVAVGEADIRRRARAGDTRVEGLRVPTGRHDERRACVDDGAAGAEDA
jgi:hypothetical protein